ncbi:hypothetical protein B0O80DRAFT_456859 [Mortierella sp. GBAus27b]|nr:hypothetical protein B0O80DRAFT_456859 [Mortierella sp. GBAus27b]
MRQGDAATKRKGSTKCSKGPQVQCWERGILGQHDRSTECEDMWSLILLLLPPLLFVLTLLVQQRSSTPIYVIIWTWGTGAIGGMVSVTGS